MSDEAILVLNAGSSSLKFAVYAPPRLDLSLRGQIAGFGSRPRLSVQDGLGQPVDLGSLGRAGDGIAAAVDWLLDRLPARFPQLRFRAAGHRVVHGGAQFDRAVRLDEATLKILESYTPLAPQHQPHNLAAIAAITRLWPALPQVACFDTAFHRLQPDIAQLYALPKDMSAAGIVRYGFHGLSYAYIAAALPVHAGGEMPGRVVVAHLGHGASMCALRDGRSVATSMGFTALDGLVMGKRCGAIDPGVLLYLLEQKGMTLSGLNDLLYEKSGLLGVSGLSDDMRDLLESDDPDAARAVDLFAYRANRELGSLVAALGGLDALVFTAGIGEHAAPVREKICRAAAWTGLELDPAANAAHGPLISSKNSPVRAWVIPTDEEGVIARDTLACV